MYNRFYKSRRVVGHILMSFITFSWIILFNYINTSAEGVRGSEHIDKREHYYSSGKKIPLLRHRMHFAVKLKNGKEDRGYITDITGSIGLKMREEVIYYPNHGIYLCKARDADGLSHDDVIRQLNNIPDVEFVQPVYVFTEGNPMIMTEEFVAQFIPDITRVSIDLAVTQGRGGKGCVILFAAGNGNESVDLDGYASYNKTIAVGASNDRDERSA